MIAKGYKLPHEFPHESFIQEVLEDFFESEGYSIIEEKPIDIGDTVIDILEKIISF